jgi:hypothetical protein
LFQKPLEDVDGITQGAGDDDIVEPGILIGGEVVGLSVICVQKVPLRKAYEINAI